MNLRKCSINIRELLTPPAIFKYGNVMIPTMYTNMNMTSPPYAHEEITPPSSRPMSMIVWNCRGAENDEFRRTLGQYWTITDPS